METEDQAPLGVTLTDFEHEPGTARAVLLGDLVRELVSDAEQAAEAAKTSLFRGPVTAIPPLDRALNGCLRPGLHVITGDPGSGKSALALQVAAKCGCPAIYVTAEQSALELFRRIISQTTNVPLDVLREADAKRVGDLAAATAGKAPQVLLVDATSAPAGVEQIVKLVHALRARCQSRHVLLIIDALQPWSRGIRTGAEYETIEASLSDLVGLTNRLKVPTLVLSHRNRAASGSGGANMTAAKGSASFEHMSESVWHLARAGDECHDRFVQDAVRVEVGIAKNRHGPAGYTVRLDFLPKTQLFVIPLS
jgi:replicative DNA helicase